MVFQGQMFVVCCLVSCCLGDYLDVKIDQGIVRGYDNDDVDMYSFYGIPYATAPKGIDRFKSALPPPTWPGIFNATDNSTICLQQKFHSDDFYKLNRNIECLNVNVFVPKTNETNLPVFMFIHGGALMNGYGMELSPKSLVKKGMIAVTFNFRVGILGFMCLGTEKVPGNAGLKDQVLAMKWVRHNIEHFGGDPSKATLSGCSAGSLNVELHLLSPLSQGLFSQAILESGSSMALDYIHHSHDKAAIEQANGMGGNCTSKDEVEIFFTSVPEERLSAKIDTGTSSFLPCIENNKIVGVERFLEESPTDTALRGDYNKVPIISAFAPHEGLVWMAEYSTLKVLMEENFSDILPNAIRENREEIATKVRDFYFPTGEVTQSGYIDYFTDSVFVYPQYVFARLHSRNSSTSGKVFLYVFTFNGSIRLLGLDDSITGTGHIPETLYVYDYDATIIYENVTNDDLVMREKLREYYYNFCKYGNPTPNAAGFDNWIPFNETESYYFDINLETKSKQWPLRERIAFWDEIFNGKFTLPKSLPTNNIIMPIFITVSLFVGLSLLVLVKGKNKKTLSYRF